MEDEENTVIENGENEPQFDLTPEQATGFDNAADVPGKFNRKRVMITLCIIFSLVLGGGLLINISRSNKKNAKAEEEVTAGAVPSSFLSSLRDRAANNRDAQPEASSSDELPPPEPALPQVSFTRSPEVEAVRNYPPPQSAPPAAPPAPAQQGPDLSSVYRSPLIPQVEGSLFAGTRQAQQTTAAQQPGSNVSYDYLQNALAMQQNAARGAYGNQPSDYASQNNQDNKQSFYDSSNNGGSVMNGRFLGENAVWIGTVIPGILETAINTDLPGNVLARVTHHIYDSQTGSKLLIPQGTILLAKYNSSVSYAQHRVQIVWDTLIRPDGYQLDLDGMNSVDKSGMSGQEAVYHENWFEYLKAAGIITMFSLANASMTENAAKYANDSSALAVSGSNAELVNQLGGNMVSRAMNIQPTLTVANGTLINIMLNKTLYLPPAEGLTTAQKYILE
jgi:type IV secretion system protein VirB10